MGKKYTAKQTKNMILDVATHLFIKKGYENTSILDIVKNLDGLTKGAIYHHFGSKNGIIIGVARRFFPTDDDLRQIDEDDSKNGLVKIQSLLLETMFNHDQKQNNPEAYLLLNDPVFYSIYIREMTQILSPKIECYLLEGNQDQSTNTPQPKQMAEIMILLISTWFIAELYPNTADTFWDKVSACQYVLKQSGVDVLNEDVLQKILNRLTEKGITIN
ncbi:TetR/AcrR family transcriptional regulator [Vagococcus sp.]|uniref:TetR/AcrR family transcriptional regulator n=1 Tax=Vagococcus sp. TaxID=1933889 RepID=UPI003F99FD05